MNELRNVKTMERLARRKARIIRFQSEVTALIEEKRALREAIISYCDSVEKGGEICESQTCGRGRICEPCAQVGREYAKFNKLLSLPASRFSELAQLKEKVVEAALIWWEESSDKSEIDLNFSIFALHDFQKR